MTPQAIGNKCNIRVMRYHRQSRMDYLNGFAWDRFWASAFGGTLLAGYFAIPQMMWVLIAMMCLDFVMGTVYAIVQHEFSVTKFGVGIIKKMAVFLMLGAIKLMAQFVLEMQGNPLEFFAKGVMCYEFLSMCDTYIKFGAPGGPTLQLIADKVRAVMAAMLPAGPKQLDQDEVSARLEDQKRAGQAH